MEVKVKEIIYSCEIKDNYLVVGISKDGDPLILASERSPNSLFFGFICGSEGNFTPTIASSNGYRFPGKYGIKDTVEALIENGGRVFACEPKKWNLALIWLLKNAKKYE